MKLSKERKARISSAAQTVDAHHQELIDKNLAIQEEKAEGDDEPPLYEEEDAVEDIYDASKEDEEELRRTVQGVFELEEALLSQHMSNIQENAEMLTQEGKLLQSIQAGGMSEDEMDK